ncbi:MAG TPA: SDR family oxidoreductase [Acidimicrobiales bacterium]|jgi:3-oxoacyl-[acyl-carrier protein] reductase|nr:SDR family oxidoreductase [Acidimicrobiales bacterium]
MDLGIAGRCAAVAGASGGLGLGCAQALAADGVRVVLCGRDAARAEAAAHDIRDAGGDAVGLAADVSTVDGAAGFVARAIDALGRLDIVVANAGGPPAGTFASTDVDAYLPALELNLLSTVAMCKAAVPAMVERGWGRIVAITSLTVRQPAASLILSNTARAGATGFLKTLAREVAPHGVTVNSVQPGSHDTDRLRELHGGDLAGAAAGIPAGTVGDPADFGAAVAFLCSERARFVTGVALPVDGGSFSGLQ